MLERSLGLASHLTTAGAHPSEEPSSGMHHPSTSCLSAPNWNSESCCPRRSQQDCAMTAQVPQKQGQLEHALKWVCTRAFKSSGESKVCENNFFLALTVTAAAIKQIRSKQTTRIKQTARDEGTRANTVKLPFHATLTNMVGLCMPSPLLKPSSLSHECSTWAPCECTCMQNSQLMHSEIIYHQTMCVITASRCGSVLPQLISTRMKMPAFPSQLFKFWQNTAGTTAHQI